MELRRFWIIFSKWAWLLAVATVLAAGVSYVVSRATTPVYSASTTILVNQAQNPASPDYNSVLTSERLTQTYSQLLRTRPILLKVIQELGLPLTPEELDRKNCFFSPDGSLLALATTGPGFNRTEILESATGKKRCDLPAAVGAHYCAFSTDNRRVAWFADDGVIQVADTETGRMVRTFLEPRTRWNQSGTQPALCFSPDRRYLASWDEADSGLPESSEFRSQFTGAARAVTLREGQQETDDVAVANRDAVALAAAKLQ